MALFLSLKACILDHTNRQVLELPPYSLGQKTILTEAKAHAIHQNQGTCCNQRLYCMHLAAEPR
jgi:hypothetical protein